MKFKTLASFLVTFLLLLTASARVVGQQTTAAQGQNKLPPRYKVVFISTFGGPNSHFSVGGTRILNNNGMFTGFADTPEPDPYAPEDECWDGDCFVAHTFRWSHGELTELHVLDGGPNSESNWISENGLIAGDSQNGLLDPLVGFWQIHGVLWSGNQTIDVGTLDGGYNSLTRGVNTNGEVVGFSTTQVPDSNAMILSVGLPYAFQTRAFRWKDGNMQDLGTLGGPDAMALRINERGQIAGNSYINSELSDFCGLQTGGFLWEHGEMADLGGFGGTCTTVSDMNNRGQVVGGSLLAGDQAQHAFLWQNGKMTDLGTLGGNFASAVAINEAGDVVGFQTLPRNDTVFHATLWKRGTIFDIGALQTGGCSLATSFNSHLQVVGINSSDCNLDDDPSLRAIISDGGAPAIDLNTLIPADSGVQLRNASTINERGEIVAVGVYPDGNHGPVLLIPCKSESAQAETCQNSGAPLLGTGSALAFARTNNKSPQWLTHPLGLVRISVHDKHYFGPVGWIGKRQ